MSESPRPPTESANELEHVQQWLQRAILAPLGAGGHDTQIGALATNHIITPSTRLSSVERVAIYRDAYQQRLIECLRDDYPALAHALGEADFASLAEAYIAAHPSSSPNLNGFGRHLTAFCRHGDARSVLPTSALRAADGGGRETVTRAFAADLAELEWALVEVLHAASPPRLSAETLGAIAPAEWPAVRLTASPTLRVIASAYPVNAYYQAWREDRDPPLPTAAPAATAVFRDGPTLWRMDLSPGAAALLLALVGGASLAGALDEITRDDAMAATDAPHVMRWFQEWVGHGFFADIQVAPQGPSASRHTDRAAVEGSCPLGSGVK